MFEIFKCEYRKNKKLILFYISLCVLVSVFVSPFLTADDLFNVRAAGVTDVIEAGEMLTEGETLLSLSDIFTKSAMKKLAGSYSSVVGVSCEPFTALLFLGVVENVNKWVGSPMDISSTPAGNPIVLIVVLLFFVASKLMKSNEATKVLGICTLGELEKYLGLVFILILGVINVVGITDVFVTNTVSAASLSPTPNSNFLVGILTSVFSVFMAIVSLVVYFVVKTVMFGIDALQACFSFIPGSGFVFEFVQSAFVVVLLSINVFFPWLGVILNIIVFIICLIMFRICYTIEEYVRKIHIKPFFASIKGYDSEFPIVSRKLPKRIKKIYEEAGSDIRLSIPAYFIKSKETEAFKIKFFTKVWLVSDGNEFKVYAKKNSFSKKYNVLTIKNKEEKPVFIKKDFRFIEIYSAMNSKKRKSKDIRIVFSNEYFGRFDNIVEILELENYNAIRSAEKLTKKEQRREKRELKKERIKEKQEACVNWFKNLFNKKDKELS